MRQREGKKREGGRREWEWEWEWQRISTMQGMCRTCCTFHAASLSLLSHMPSFFLSFSIYKTSLPFGSILQFSFHNHMCPPMCPLLSLSSSQGSLLAPIPHSHAPFREAIYHIYLHSKSLSCPFPFVIFFYIYSTFSSPLVKVVLLIL